MHYFNELVEYITLWPLFIKISTAKHGMSDSIRIANETVFTIPPDVYWREVYLFGIIDYRVTTILPHTCYCRDKNYISTYALPNRFLLSAIITASGVQQLIFTISTRQRQIIH